MIKTWIDMLFLLGIVLFLITWMWTGLNANFYVSFAFLICFFMKKLDEIKNDMHQVKNIKHD